MVDPKYNQPPSDSEDEMEAESDLDNGDEEITDLVSDGENA